MFLHIIAYFLLIMIVYILKSFLRDTDDGFRKTRIIVIKFKKNFINDLFY